MVFDRYRMNMLLFNYVITCRLKFAFAISPHELSQSSRFLCILGLFAIFLFLSLDNAGLSTTRYMCFVALRVVLKRFCTENLFLLFE